MTEFLFIGILSNRHSIKSQIISSEEWQVVINIVYPIAKGFKLDSFPMTWEFGQTCDDFFWHKLKYFFYKKTNIFPPTFSEGVKGVVAFLMFSSSSVGRAVPQRTISPSISPSAYRRASREMSIFSALQSSMHALISSWTQISSVSSQRLVPWALFELGAMAEARSCGKDPSQLDSRLQLQFHVLSNLEGISTSPG